MKTNEAFSLVKIDAQLKDQGWNTQNPNLVRFEYVLPDGTRADYVLCDRNGRSLAVVEAKKSAVNPADAAGQAKAYAQQLNVPFILLTNGEEIRFWDWQLEAHPREISTFFGPVEFPAFGGQRIASNFEAGPFVPVPPYLPYSSSQRFEDTHQEIHCPAESAAQALLHFHC